MTLTGERKSFSLCSGISLTVFIPLSKFEVSLVRCPDCWLARLSLVHGSINPSNVLLRNLLDAFRLCIQGTTSPFLGHFAIQEMPTPAPVNGTKSLS